MLQQMKKLVGFEQLCFKKLLIKKEVILKKKYMQIIKH